MSLDSPPSALSQPFDAHAVAVLSRLRSFLTEAIGAIPGNINRPTDLQRAAKIDMNLSWRLFKVMRASDPLSAGPHVPGPAHIRGFLKAAANLGVRAEILDALKSASDEFHELVKHHAGDRHTFNSMVSALVGNGDTDQFNLLQRRNAFRANRHLWGAQANTRVRCAFLNIGDDPDKVALASLDGYLDLRQLRRSATLPITSARLTTDSRAPFPIQAHPLGPESAVDQGIALLPQFCSQPMPQLEQVRVEGGNVQAELVCPEIGNKGAITCFTGWWAQNAAPRYCDEKNSRAALLNQVRVPCDLILICVLVRRGLFGDSKPKLAIYSDHRPELPYPNRDERLDDLLLPDEQVAFVGQSAASLSTPDVPRLTEMVQFVFDRLDWDGQQFDAYRCRIAYPIMPSTIELTIELPAKPA